MRTLNVSSFSTFHHRLSNALQLKSFPLCGSILLHLGLLLTLLPGHDQDHTVQLFEGILELGEAGDGHDNAPHFHSESRRLRKPPKMEAQPNQDDSAIATEPSSPEATALQDSPGDPEPVDLSASLASGSGGRTLSESERYLRLVLQRIDEAKTYPRDSILREEEGVVVVSIVIRRDGAVQEVSLTRSSPFQRLNQAALEAAQKLKELPPLPSSWTRSIKLQVPLKFQIDTR